MGYDLIYSFPVDSEPNGVSFGSKSKGKRSPLSYLIQCERKWKCSFLSPALLASRDRRIVFDVFMSISNVGTFGWSSFNRLI